MDSRIPLKVAGIAAQRKIGLKRFGPFELLQYLSLVASLRAGISNIGKRTRLPGGSHELD
jgi:hypothetical protein